MGSAVSTFQRLSPADRSAAIARAAKALAASQPVIFPTETVYGVAVNAASRPALERFAALPRPGMPPHPSKPWLGRPPWTWHAPSVAAVESAIPLFRPIHRRLLDTLAPGPVRFVFELSEADATAAAQKIGAVPDALAGQSKAGPNLGWTIAVRVPRHEVAAAVLAQVPGPVIVERLSRFGWGDHPCVPGLIESAAAAGIDAVIDDGPGDERRSSTSIALHPGGYRVLEVGAVSERAVKRAATRMLLFVCTGNTCRSPMAAAAAQHLLAAERDLTASGIETVAGSAGVAASDGQPMTPEAVAALADLGIAARPNRSRQLNRPMIDEAEVIYVMTGSHREAVLSIDRGAASKIVLLDPAGKDIPDPYGGPPAVYASAAKRIIDVVRRRLTELDSQSRSSGNPLVGL